MQPNIPALLHEQYRFYTAELGRTHQGLSKLYRKLARIERVLAAREERTLTRKDKKKIQWTRTVTRDTVHKLEAQQAGLHEYLRQCGDLIASYGSTSIASVYHLPPTPWTAHLPPSPYAAPFSPYSPVAANPWTSVPARPCIGGDGVQQGPQYWDLSMLRERRQSSPNASSADSGFYEPAMYAQPFDLEGASDPNHVFAHELMSPGSTYSSHAEASAGSKKSSFSEGDDLPELPNSPVSPSARLGADIAKGTTTGHRRRYSENAIQLIEDRLAAPRPQQQRGTSVGPAPRSKRNRDVEDRSFEERHVEEAASVVVHG
ncbi:hypothetical protein LTR85_005233 [Meristemomyces frigidus]|nr:hypothetical protein LTR85_005233 [Meristemomyces frigidus]